MSKGDRFASESVEFCDFSSGIKIRQVTGHESIHHHPFYYVPAYDNQMNWLFFVSHRFGAPQIFAEQRDNGELVQLTDRDDLNEWSLHPSHDGSFLCFTTQTGGWKLDLESFKEEQLVDFAGAKKSAGMVGAGMGTTSLSHDDHWWLIPVRRHDVAQLLLVNTATGESTVVCENEVVGHPQFHPEDANLIRYGGPYDRRIWVVHRDGTDNRLVYRRDDSRKEWIVHECWRPGSREILTTNWPHGVMAIDIDTEDTRWVTKFNAWHPMVDPTGKFMIADTKNPDHGLFRFDIGEIETVPTLVCHSDSSNMGEHWNIDHCPYDEGPVDVFAPQHTHPHPSIAPDGKHFLFTSDRTGSSQLYEVKGI